MKCACCDGTGKFPLSVNVCPVCRGRGELPDDRKNNPVCKVCDGSGNFPLSTDICETCGGWGRLPDSLLLNAGGKGPIAVFVEAGKPRKAHLQLSGLFAELQGDLRICDPYYGAGSLFRLDLLTHCKTIRFLTKNPDSKEKPILNRAVKEFVTQHPHVAFRTDTTSDLHDRYVLTPDEIIILGHGLKDIGAKDSFLIRLDRAVCKDLIDTVTESFDRRWTAGKPLP